MYIFYAIDARKEVKWKFYQAINKITGNKICDYFVHYKIIGYFCKPMTLEKCHISRIIKTSKCCIFWLDNNPLSYLKLFLYIVYTAWHITVLILARLHLILWKAVFVVGTPVFMP